MSYALIREQLKPASIALSGEKTVAAAATPEVLAASTKLKKGVIVQAKSTNTGAVFVGNQAGQFHELNALDSVIIPWDNLALVWIKVAVNDEGVNYMAG